MKQLIFTFRSITISNLIINQFAIIVEMSFINQIVITFTFIVSNFTNDSTNHASILKHENDLNISTRRNLVTIIILEFRKQMIRRARELIYVTFSAFKKRDDSQIKNTRENKKRDRFRESDQKRDSISFSAWASSFSSICTLRTSHSESWSSIESCRFFNTTFTSSKIW
jgi:hypothetical protein